MSDNRPIGIFDSGIGGLTVANSIYKTLPKESLIYFGDTVHFPFGDKSVEVLQKYCLTICQFLLEKNCKCIVIACNTASSVTFEYLKEQLPDDFLIINVIDPVVKKVHSASLQSIGIIATPATIRSQVYSKKLLDLKPNLDLHTIAAKSLASIIEEELHTKESLIMQIIEHYFKNDQFQNIEGLILGCTHYPVIKEQIDKFYKQKIKIFDSPQIVAQAINQILLEKNILNDGTIAPKYEFFISDYTTSFENMTRIFFDMPVKLIKKML